jgi:hypothetical protein
MEETPSIQQSEFRASTPDERENALGGNMQQVPQSNEIEGPVEEQDKSHEFVSMDSMIASLNEMVKDMSEAELRTRLEMIVGKSVNIHNMDDLTDEDMKKIIANPMAGAYFRALVTKG